MKLLFDQNISFRILKKIADFFPDAQQTFKLNLNGSTDLQIWEYAKLNKLCIVTFDSDFIDISVLRGSPPKIIWLRTGNTSTDVIADILISNQVLIKQFMQSEEASYLELS